MHPPDNSPLKWNHDVTNWQPIGRFGAREKLNVSVENNHVDIQIVAQSAFAHAVVRFLKFFGSNVSEDLWKSIKSKESKDLTNTQIKNLIEQLPKNSTSFEAKALLQRIQQEILPSLEKLQDPSLPREVSQEAKQKAASLKKAANQLRNTLSEIGESLASQESSPVFHHISTKHDTESELFQSVENIHTATTNAFTDLKVKVQLKEKVQVKEEVEEVQVEIEEFQNNDEHVLVSNEHVLANEEHVLVDDQEVLVDDQEALVTEDQVSPLDSTKQITSLDTSISLSPEDSLDELKTLARKIQNNSIQILTALKKSEAFANNTPSSSSAIINEIEKVRNSVQNVLKTTNLDISKVPLEDLEKHFASINSLSDQTEKWLSKVQDIHATIIKKNALERRCEDVLKKLEDIAFIPLDIASWRKTFEEQQSSWSEHSNLEELLQQEAKFDKSMAQLCEELAHAAPEHFQNLQKEVLGGITNKTILKTCQKKWNTLEKHMPKADANWFSFHVWYSELNKTITQNIVLSKLEQEHPKGSFATLIQAATKRAGLTGLAILKNIDSKQLDDEIFYDDIAPELNKDLVLLIEEMQKAFEQMAGQQNLTISQAHQWIENLRSLTEKSLNTYNLSSEAEKQLPQDCALLQALTPCIDLLVECHNIRNEDFLEEKRSEFTSSNSFSKDTAIMIFFDTYMEKLDFINSWNPNRPIADFNFVDQEWSKAEFEIKRVTECLEELISSLHTIDKMKTEAYEEANKAPEKAQKGIEIDALNVIFTNISKKEVFNLEKVRDFSNNLQKLKKDNASQSKSSAILDSFTFHTIQNYTQDIRQGSVTFEKETQEIQLRNKVRLQIQKKVAQAYDHIADYENKVLEIEQWLDVSLMPRASTSLSETKKILEKIKAHDYLDLPVASRSWWYFGEIFWQKATPKWLSDSHSLSIQTLLKEEKLVQQLIEQQKEVLETSFPVAAFYKTFLIFKNQHARIEKQIQELYEKGQIENGDHLTQVLEHKLISLQAKCQLLVDDRLDKLLGLGNNQIDVADELKKAMSNALEEWLMLSQKASQYPILKLFSQIPKANTPEKVAHLKKNCVQQIHSQIEEAQKKWKNEVQKAYEMLEKEEVFGNLKADLEGLLASHNSTLQQLTTSVPLKEGSVWQGNLWRNTHTVTIEDLHIQDVTQYNQVVKEAINKGTDAIIYATSEIKKLMTAEENYKEALSKAVERSEWLDKNNHIAHQYHLSEVIKEVSEEYDRGLEKLVLRKDALQKNTLASIPYLSAAIPSVSLGMMGSVNLSTISKYNVLSGNLAGKLIQATQMATDAPLYSFYPDQLNDKNLSPKIATEIRQRFFKSMNGEIDRGIADLKKHLETANGSLEAYLTPVWKLPSQITNPKSYLYPDTVPLQSFVDVKISQLEQLKHQFKQEGYLSNTYIAVDDRLSSKQLKEYSDLIKSTKSNLKKQLENETHLNTAHKYLTMYQTKVAEAKIVAEKFKEKKQFSHHKDLSDEITQVELWLESKKNSLSSKDEVVAFTDYIKKSLSTLQKKIAASKYQGDQSLIEQIEGLQGDSSDLAKTLRDQYIIDSKELIRKYKVEDIVEVEGMVNKLLEKSIIVPDLKTTFENILSAEKFGGIVAFEKPQKVKIGSTEKLQSLQDLSLSDLKNYDNKLRKRVLEFDNDEFNPECELVKINEDTQIKPLYEALYGPEEIGYYETLKKLDKLTAKVTNAYDDPDVEKELKSKLDILKTLALYLIENFAKNISSKHEMHIVSALVSAQVKHLNTIIERLNKQIRQNKIAKKTVKKAAKVVSVDLPPLAQMQLLEKRKPNNYKTKPEYLSARWEFLTGNRVPPATIGTIPEAAIGGAAPVPRAFVAMGVLPKEGSPHYNAAIMASNLSTVWRDVALALNASKIPWEKTQLQKLDQFLQGSIQQFLHWHQGVPVVGAGIQLSPSLNNIENVDDLIKDYVVKMQKHYLVCIQHIQTEIDAIGNTKVKLPNMFKDIEWKY